MRRALLFHHESVLVLGGVEVKQAANHFLILRMMLFCFLFEEVDTGLTQSNGNFT